MVQKRRIRISKFGNKNHNRRSIENERKCNTINAQRGSNSKALVYINYV